MIEITGLMAIVFPVALVCGFLSGLLGIGGGIVMAPMLLYVPPLLGFAQPSMHTVAGLTIVQGLVACLSGVAAHREFNSVSGRLTAWMGGAIFMAALAGGAGAVYVSNSLLLALFGLLAITAAAMMLLPLGDDPERPDPKELDFTTWRAVAAAVGVGLLGGLVGQGGSFILIPLMIHFVRVPTRLALGSNLAIVLLSTLAAFIGKAVTGQIDWLLALPVMLAVGPAAYLGGYVSNFAPVAVLRRILAVVIGLAALRICLSI